MVVGNDFFELEVDKVLGVERTLHLLWFDWSVGLVEVPISTACSKTCGEKDEWQIAAVFGRSSRVCAGSRDLKRYSRLCCRGQGDWMTYPD